MKKALVWIVASFCCQSEKVLGFQSSRGVLTTPKLTKCQNKVQSWSSILSLSSKDMDMKKPPRESWETKSELSGLDATNRFPTSVEDQVRQAALALQRASSAEGVQHRRHLIRLLLPMIGATDLDDWPGGARQMMEAAYPLVTGIFDAFGKQQQQSQSFQFQQVLLDASDGVYAILAQAQSSKDDACAVLLPTANDIVLNKIIELDQIQVGPTRNLILVNPQWKRRSDFGGNYGSWFGIGNKNNNKGRESSQYIENTFVPTFSLTNLIVQGESIRVLRTYPGPWRVYCRTIQNNNDDNSSSNNVVVDWVLVGTKAFVARKPADWEDLPENKRDGGLLFSYGMPTYREVEQMLQLSPKYTPKNPSQRAMAAFNFIKDTL